MDTSQNLASKNVQSEMNRLLKASPSSDGAKACLFNLIVYTQDERRTAYLNEIVKLIKTQFPCRIIFIKGDPEAKENEFKVKASSEKNSDGSGFVCDEFYIEASGQDVSRVNYLLLPLFVPDLPIYLLWGQDPTTEYSILPHLESFANRLIFDAETTEDLQQFSRQMLSRLDSSSIQIVDMNWARLGGWQEVISQIYDSQERFNQIATSNFIEIKYNNRPSDLFTNPDTQAIYFQAWLATCLEWHFVKEETKDHARILYYQRSNQEKCQIKLTPSTDSSLDPEEILEVEVSGNQDYHCHMKRTSLIQVKVQSSNHYECGLPFVLLMPNLKSGRSFMQEIFYQKTSEQYKKMLQLVSLIRWG